jgi:hypothetical protein
MDGAGPPKPKLDSRGLEHMRKRGCVCVCVGFSVRRPGASQDKHTAPAPATPLARAPRAESRVRPQLLGWLASRARCCLLRGGYFLLGLRTSVRKQRLVIAVSLLA